MKLEDILKDPRAAKRWAFIQRELAAGKIIRFTLGNSIVKLVKDATLSDYQDLTAYHIVNSHSHWVCWDHEGYALDSITKEEADAIVAKGR